MSSSTMSPAATASAVFSCSSSPTMRTTGSVALRAICWRKASGRMEGTLERFENRADHRLGELGADAVERVGFLREEGVRVEGIGGRRRLVFLSEQPLRVVPDHLVGVHVAELDLCRDLDDVAAPPRLGVEAGRAAQYGE